MARKRADEESKRNSARLIDATPEELARAILRAKPRPTTRIERVQAPLKAFIKKQP